MNKQQKLKIALPILGVIMAFIWGPVIMGGGSKQKKKENTGSAGASTAQQDGDIDLVVLARSGERKKARTSYDKWGRNPFKLVQDPLDLVVEGIVWDEESPKAIVNGNIVAIGDKIGSIVITDIRKNGVTMKNGAKKFELSFGADE